MIHTIWNEIRFDDKGQEDDIVLSGDIHLENMDDRNWWLGIYRGNKRTTFWISTKGGKITVKLLEHGIGRLKFPRPKKGSQE